jgi:hypothetical protein
MKSPPKRRPRRIDFMNASLRRTFAALFAAFILLAAGLPAARAADEAPTLQRILSDRYGAMRLAMGGRDKARVEAMLAPGFHSVALSGRTEDAAQMLKPMTDASVLDRPKIFTTKVEVVKQDGDRAVVAQTYEMKTVKQRSDGAADLVRIVAFSDDTWVKKGDDWLLQSTEATAADLYINEKLQKHAVRQTPAPASSPAPAQ